MATVKMRVPIFILVAAAAPLGGRKGAVELPVAQLHMARMVSIPEGGQGLLDQAESKEADEGSNVGPGFRCVPPLEPEGNPSGGVEPHLASQKHTQLSCQFGADQLQCTMPPQRAYMLRSLF